MCASGDNHLFGSWAGGLSQVTSVGKVWTGYDLQITAIDPLADAYADLYRDAGVSPPIVPLKLDGEKLSSRHVHQPQRNCVLLPPAGWARRLEADIA
jgi:hypothetical protein